MRHQRENEPGERGGRRLKSPIRDRAPLDHRRRRGDRIVVYLQAAAASQATHSSPAPVARQPITPSPVPIVSAVGFRLQRRDDSATHHIVLFGGVGNYPNTCSGMARDGRWAHPQAIPRDASVPRKPYDPQRRR